MRIGLVPVTPAMPSPIRSDYSSCAPGEGEIARLTGF